jgi:hypothetical protein
LTRDEEAELLYGPNWRVTNQSNGRTTVKTEPDDTVTAVVAPTVAGSDSSDTTAGAAAADIATADTATAAAAGADDSAAMDVVSDATAAAGTTAAAAADTAAADAVAADAAADGADADADAAANSTKTVESLSVKFRVLDSLPGLGPITTIQVSTLSSS